VSTEVATFFEGDRSRRAHLVKDRFTPAFWALRIPSQCSNLFETGADASNALLVAERSAPVSCGHKISVELHHLPMAVPSTAGETPVKPIAVWAKQTQKKRLFVRPELSTSWRNNIT